MSSTESITNAIPLVIIAFETYTFIKQFIDHVAKYFNTVIIIDNNSKYPILLEYYDTLEKQDSNKYKIHRLPVNHGHTVYLKNIVELPPVYVLSDPDLQLNPNIPDNFVSELYSLSNTYRAYKVGFALELDEAAFIKDMGVNTFLVNSQQPYWSIEICKLNNKEPVYKAPIDTTFCLINNNYKTNRGWKRGLHLRVAGCYTCKHLPWYENYVQDNMPLEEYNYWKNGNVSSSIIMGNLKLKS